MTYEDSVSNWLTRLSGGDERAIEIAFDRYFKKLTRLATSKMTGLNQAQRSGEDVALSAFRSFCSSVKVGRLVVEKETDLWTGLFLVVTRKVCAERRRQLADKRGGKSSQVDHFQIGENGEEEDLLANVAGNEPSPELASEMASQAEEVLRLFGKNPKRRRILELRLLGWNDEEIAKELLLTRRTIRGHVLKICELFEFVSSVEILFEELFSKATLDEAAKTAGLELDTAQRIVDVVAELWKKEFGQIPSFPPAQSRNLGNKFVLLKERIRGQWLDDLLNARRPSSNSF